MGLIFALLVALFAVVNVNSVAVNFLFAEKEIPLILVIIGSALLGGLMVGSFGIVRQYRLQWRIKKLEQELAAIKQETTDETSPASPERTGATPDVEQEAAPASDTPEEKEDDAEEMDKKDRL
ncbi:MAG: DUF1049 domain-containing protein [Bacillaceae bacterium]|nr:DUF1049 domain-containing protein [Bacillaceae bacterium]